MHSDRLLWRKKLNLILFTVFCWADFQEMEGLSMVNLPSMGVVGHGSLYKNGEEAS